VRNLRHQLRTPVNHIVGFGDMLQEEAADRGWNTLLPDLERISCAGRQLTEYIDSTVDLARVEAGQMDPEQVSRDLRTPLESIIGYSQLLQEEADENGWHEALPDLRNVELAAKQLTSLIEAVLELAKIYGREPSSLRAPRHAPARPPEPQASASTKATGSVLVADDNPLDAEMLSRRLEALGYQVTTASSGQDALAALREQSFDLLLLDVIMPEQDGLATLRALKSESPTSEVPVLMVSAVEEIPIVARCIELGAEDYLVKPVDAVLLRAKVQASLDRRRLFVLLREIGALQDAVVRLAAGVTDPASLRALARREDEVGRLAQAVQRLFEGRAGVATP